MPMDFSNLGVSVAGGRGLPRTADLAAWPSLLDRTLPHPEAADEGIHVAANAGAAGNLR